MFDVRREIHFLLLHRKYILMANYTISNESTCVLQKNIVATLQNDFLIRLKII